MIKGAFTYDVKFLGRLVGQAASDFTKYAYVVKCLIRVHSVSYAYAVLPFYDVKCLCSRGQE